jgi:hypothetical protein
VWVRVPPPARICRIDDEETGMPYHYMHSEMWPAVGSLSAEEINAHMKSWGDSGWELFTREALVKMGFGGTQSIGYSFVWRAEVAAS